MYLPACMSDDNMSPMHLLGCLPSLSVHLTDPNSFQTLERQVEGTACKNAIQYRHWHLQSSYRQSGVDKAGQ